MLDRQTTTGLAPAYLPKDEEPRNEAKDEEGKTS
jgi:hypothetical protein